MFLGFKLAATNNVAKKIYLRKKPRCTFVGLTVSPLLLKIFNKTLIDEMCSAQDSLKTITSSKKKRIDSSFESNLLIIRLKEAHAFLSPNGNRTNS